MWDKPNVGDSIGDDGEGSVLQPFKDINDVEERRDVDRESIVLHT